MLVKTCKEDQVRLNYFNYKTKAPQQQDEIANPQT